MEEDMAKLVADAHIDAHRSKKNLMLDVLSLHLTFWAPFAPRVACRHQAAHEITNLCLWIPSEGFGCITCACDASRQE
jgi:hypothetical protein